MALNKIKEWQLDLSETNAKYETLHNDLDELGDQVSEIESKIPAEASYRNQLADKAYVNSVIGGGSGGGSVSGNLYTEGNLVPGKNIAFIKGGYHKILSNFSSSQYVKFIKNFNPANSYRMIVGLTTGSNVTTTQSILSVQEVDRNFYLKGSGSVFSYYHGSSVAGSTVAAANTAYWLVFDYDGTTCKLYSAKDDGTYVNPKDLPALTDGFWTEELSSTTEIFKGKDLQLGKNGSTTAYWFGSINLGKVLITADEEDWFNGLTAEEGVDYTNLGCTVTNERVEGLEVATSIDCVIEKLSQLEDDLGVYTKTNLIGGNGITIEEQTAQGGIDKNTLACWPFDVDNVDVVNGYTIGSYTRNYYRFGTGGSSLSSSSVSGIVFNSEKELTVDYWLYLRNYASDCTVGFSELNLNINAGSLNTVTLAGSYLAESVAFTFDNPLVKETWGHIAFTYKNYKVCVFINGVKVGEADTLTAKITSGSAFRFAGSTYNYYAIDELRISDIVRYIKDFTPPTEAYAKGLPRGTFLINNTGEAFNQHNFFAGEGLEIVPFVPEGGNDEHTTFLLDCDNEIVDSSQNAIAITTATGTPTYEASVNNFGEAMCYKNGSLGFGNTKAFNFDGDFTIDFWAKASSLEDCNGDIYFSDGSGTYGFAFGGGMLDISIPADDGMFAPVEVAADTYNHYALERYNNNMTFFLNGTPQETLASTSVLAYTSINFMCSGTNAVCFDEVRVSKIARYQGEAFTVPTIPYFVPHLDIDKFQLNLKGGTGSGKSIGEVFYSLSDKATDNPGSLPLFTGETIASANTIYPDFYKWISEREELQITSDKYEEALANFGECPKYVLDIASTEETNSYKYTFPTTVPDGWVLAYLDNGEYVEFEENGVYYSPVKIDHEYTLSSDELYYDEGLTKRIFVRMLYQSEPYQWFPVVFQTASDGSDTNGWILVLGRDYAGFSPFYEDGAETTTISSTAALAPEESVVTRTTYTRDGSLRLPKLANYIKMANTTDGITQGEAGLPNITGSVGGVSASGDTDGAFEAEEGGVNGNYASGNNWVVSKLNASRSSEVYGNSDTVTPAHTTLYPWVHAFSKSVGASTAQAAEFQNGLSGKADTNLDNVTEEGKEKAVAWGRNFVNVNKTVVEGNDAGTIGTYELGFTDGKVKIGVFNLGFNTTTTSHTNLGITTDVVSNIVYIGGTNNGFATTNTVTVPFINSVTLLSTNTSGGLGNNALVLVGYFE